MFDTTVVVVVLDVATGPVLVVVSTAEVRTFAEPTATTATTTTKNAPQSATRRTRGERRA